MNQVAKIDAARPSLIATMARAYNMDPKQFADAVRATCMPANASNEEFAAFLMVAKEYDLNPITREIYAFPKKGGGIQPIVGIDGWMNLINSHPQCDGLEFDDKFDDKGHLASITCRIFRKDRGRPTMVTEYMDECKRPTEPWTKWPARMLRHKAAIQCARYAFGFAGIIDPEEAERSPEVITGTVVAPPPPQAQIAAPAEIDHSEIVDETGEATEALTEAEPVDYGDYFERLQEAMAGTKDELSIEEVWNDFDPEATFQDDADSMELATSIKQRQFAKVHPLNGM